MDLMMREDTSSEDNILTKAWDLIQHQCGSWISRVSARVCVSGWVSPAVFLFHLHGRNNDRCTGLQRIRLRDPQFKINKK